MMRAGIQVDLDAEAGARGEAAAEGSDPHGVEGVDYTLGSVDDLDPSEWQVRQMWLPFPQGLWLRQEAPDCRAGPNPHSLPQVLQVPPHCVPIHANVTTYNWDQLAQTTQVCCAGLVGAAGAWAMVQSHDVRQ